MQPKRILLMHISDISGHRSASLAIEKALKADYPQIQTRNINAFNYVYPRGEKIINSFYLLTIKRMPFIWSYLYDNYYLIKKTRKIKEAIHYMNFRKFETLFNNFHPDAVVTTQAFPCGMVADLKKKKGIHLPLVAVLTDFAAHSYWIYDNVDYYVVPSDEARQKLIDKGVKPEKIKTFGIPFDTSFNKDLNKIEMRRKLNLDPDLFTILIMGGGQGLGPIKNTVKNLDKLNLNFQEIVTCGNNKKVYSRLKKKQKHYKKKMLLLSYAHNMEELMSAADLIITKPGGITCAEALSKGLPMLIVSPIPGQEANNTSFLVGQKAAIKIANAKDLVKVITDLYNHPEKLKALSESAKRISKPAAAEDIAKLLSGL